MVVVSYELQSYILYISNCFRYIFIFLFALFAKFNFTKTGKRYIYYRISISFYLILLFYLITEKEEKRKHFAKKIMIAANF